MQSIVSDGTLVTYNQEHLKFIIYLYDLDADEFIWDEVLDDIHIAHDEVQGNERTKENRRHLRECIRGHLSLMNRFGNNCPIVLQKVSFSVFTKYMLDVRSMDENDNICYMSAATYNLMKSSFVYLFNASGQEMETGLCKELDTFLRALQKRGLQRQRLEVAIASKKEKNNALCCVSAYVSKTS
jgi:hypothetical protein